MIELSSRETNLLKGVKLHKIYIKPYTYFEEFYHKFEGTYLYSYKSVLMSFFSIHGNQYDVNQTEFLLMRDCFSLLFKITSELPPKYIEHQLDYVLGEIRIAPIGIIDEK